MIGRRALIVGAGAREHALAWKLVQSSAIGQLYVAPGNAGTADIAVNVPVSATDIDGLVHLAEERLIDLTIVGPEAPLALGLADALRANGHAAVGPDRAAARIESSKAFAKEVMTRAGVPTAAYAVFADAESARGYLAGARFPLVIKADGLAAGKGVTVCADRAEAEATIQALMVDRVHGGAGARVVIEEALEGPEISLLALVDGETIVPLPPAQDHKRLGNGDTGPNTGGMGAYAPLPWLPSGESHRLVDLILRPVVRTLAEMGIPYRGVLFAGLMLTPDGPKVLEFNCRLGDPEAQVILPLIDGDLLAWLEAVARGELHRQPAAIPVTGASAVGITLAAPGYPETPRTGESVSGLDQIPDDVLVFHAGTNCAEDGSVVTGGGRVLTVVGRGHTLEAARQRAYSTPIHLPEMQLRTDIARTLAPRFRLGVLASGSGSNLQALLDACAGGAIDAEVSVVISGSASAPALERARRGDVPAFALPFTGERRDPASRCAYDRRLLDHLRPFDLDLLVLAGWMHVLSAEFLEACPCPVINVHPALLGSNGDDQLEVEGRTVPVLRGMKAVGRALELGLPVTGVTVHRVTPQVDAGPVLLRETVPIQSSDCEESLYQRIKPVEHRLLVDAVRQMLRSA